MAWRAKPSSKRVGHRDDLHDAALDQPLDPLAHRGLRQPHRLADGGVRAAPVGLQLLDDGLGRGVQVAAPGPLSSFVVRVTEPILTGRDRSRTRSSVKESVAKHNREQRNRLCRAAPLCDHPAIVDRRRQEVIRCLLRATSSSAAHVGGAPLTTGYRWSTRRPARPSCEADLASPADVDDAVAAARGGLARLVGRDARRALRGAARASPGSWRRSPTSWPRPRAGRPASRCGWPASSTCPAPSTTPPSSAGPPASSRAWPRGSTPATTRRTCAASPSASWAPSPRGTTRCRWPPGRCCRPSPPATRSCSSPPRSRR